MLLGFDVDPCCFGYDGKDVWALPRAVRAALRLLRAQPSARVANKPTYELRLAKCAARRSCIASPTEAACRRRYAARGFRWQCRGCAWPTSSCFVLHVLPLKEQQGVQRLLYIHTRIATSLGTAWSMRAAARWFSERDPKKLVFMTGRSQLRTP